MPIQMFIRIPTGVLYASLTLTEASLLSAPPLYAATATVATNSPTTLSTYLFHSWL